MAWAAATAAPAVKQANTPTLDKLMATCPMTWLKAHGTAVGLPTDDDMGNSEVGHNALGCGQIYSQGAKLVQESIETGTLYQSKTWVELTDNCLQNGKALHFIGLLSDGNVHSNISHLIAMLTKAREMGLKKVYCHILLDGRDVPATSALEYVDQLEAVLASLSDAEHEYKIASGGGRMVITMDRYEANWPMVEKGWRTHVQGEGRQFASAKEAIETYRAENPGMIDQDLLPFVIAKDGQPVAKIANGDSVILFNFRGDRAQEISLAFDRKDFDHFDRGDYTGVQYLQETLGDFLPAEVAENLKTIIASVESTKSAEFKMAFDPTLVRGMSYYTGPIFEISMDEFGGSVGGGGRYDEMIGKFTGQATPACGFSIGFERIVMLLLERGFQIPGAGKKTAYLIEKNMPEDKLLQILDEAKQARADGSVVNIAIMKKNKKFQKEQMQAEGYEEFREFFIDRM